MDAEQTDERQADFRSFAMDPTQGVALEEEEEPIEGEAVEAVPEKKEAAPTKKAAEPKAKEAEKTEPPIVRREAAPETKAEPAKTEANGSEPEPDVVGDLFKEESAKTEAVDETELLMIPFVKQLLGDADFVGVDHARKIHATQIEALAESDPELFAQIEAALERRSN